MPFFAPNSTYGSDFSSYLYAVSVFFRFGWMFFWLCSLRTVKRLPRFHEPRKKPKLRSCSGLLELLREIFRTNFGDASNKFTLMTFELLYTQRLNCSRTEFRGSWATAWNSTWASTAAISNFALAVFSRAIWSRLFNKWMIASYFQLDRA